MNKKKINLLFLFVAVFLFIAGSISAASLNETERFFVDGFYDARGRTETDAVLKKIGSRAYFYIDEDFLSSLSSDQKRYSDFLKAVDNLSAEFDAVIYPKLTSFFGNVWDPGIDGDSKITVLIMPIIKNAGGYVNTADGYLKEMVAGGVTNEREIIYLNSDFIGNRHDKYFLAHEFQHLITFYHKTILAGSDEDIWLNELRSEYGAHYLGYNIPFGESILERRLKTFTENPSDPLAEWKNASSDYAAIAVFAQYLKGRFGGRFFQNMLKSKKKGIESINDFSGIFTDWVLANYLNDKRYGKKYSYSDSNLIFKVNPQTVYEVDASSLLLIDLKLKDWSPRYILLKPSRSLNGKKFDLNLSFSFEGDNKIMIPIIVEKKDGSKEISVFDANVFKKAIVSEFGGSVESVMLIPMNQFKTSRFSENDPSISLTVNVSSVSGFGKNEKLFKSSRSSAVSVSVPDYPDGSLLRAKGDYKVYIVKGKYKRYILSEKIFDFYPHLNRDSVIEVSKAELDWYQESALTRAEGDEEIFEINGDFTRHWLNMSARNFSISGRNWDSVFNINAAERDFYTTGADVRI